MERKYNRLYCIVIAMFILISGICLEQPKADSFFAYADHISVASLDRSSGRELSRYELTSAETLGVRDTAFVAGSMRRPSVRGMHRNRIAILILAAGVFCLKLSNLRTAVETAGAPETQYTTALLKYIREQDGKK